MLETGFGVSWIPPSFTSWPDMFRSRAEGGAEGGGKNRLQARGERVNKRRDSGERRRGDGDVEERETRPSGAKS